MKELVTLLGDYDERDPRDAALFNHLLEQVLEEALPELSDRLVRPSTSKALKRLIMASPARLPHEGWTPILLRALMHEMDPELFEDGCRVLAEIGGMEETDALRRIARQRQEPALQASLVRKLAWLEPRQPFGYHFRDLLRGSQNPSLSQKAAQTLASIASIEQLEELRPACDHPDTMVSILALRVISAIQDPQAGRFLMERFGEACDALLQDSQLRGLQEQIRRAPAQSVRSVVLDLLRGCPGAAPFGQLLGEIDKALAEAPESALTLVQRLRTEIQGLQETRLVDCLADLALGRSVRLANLMPEPPEEVRQRTQRHQSQLDACAEGIAMLARRGFMPKKEVLPRFQKAFEGGAGGDGFGHSFAILLEEGDEAQMELILKASNHRWREEGIKVLGERSSPSLLAFFMKAMADPIVDNAQLATRYFGRLTGAYEMALELFRSEKADQMERAISIFSLNGMDAAGPWLAAYLEQAEREDLMISVIDCLGTLRYGPATEVFARLLRFGQSPRLTRALAEGLMALGTDEAARCLLQKALDLRNPEIHLLAVEAIARIRPSFQQSLDPDEASKVEQLLEACFSEGMGFRLGAIEACRRIWTLDPGCYGRLENRVARLVAEQSKRPTWDRDQQQMVSGVIRDLQRRQRDLAALVGPGGRIRERVAAHVPGDRHSLEALAAGLGEPGLFLGLEGRSEVEALIGSELMRPGIDEASLEILCRMAGQVGGAALEDALGDLCQRCAARSRLHEICRGVMQALGFPEGAPPQDQDVLVLDPSAFFRKRILGVLEGGRVREAKDRSEAQGMLDEAPVDLIVSESSDAAGDLQAWLAGLWRARRIRRVILSTASRTEIGFRESPWLAGILLKPYPMEQLLALLRG